MCGCFVGALQTGLTNWTNSIGTRQTVAQQHQLPKDSSDLLKFKTAESERLKFNASTHQEPNKHSHYVLREKEYVILQNALGCLGRDLKELKRMPCDKQNYHTIEYATISGAGKSRYVLRQLGGDSKFHNIPMSLVALNFNGGTGGGCDLRSVQGTTLPTNAMSRLLLSRGLFGVHPDMPFLTGLRVSDESLPPLQQVIDALFLDRFSDPSGEGLLVVHLDELWLLKEIKGDQWIKDFICTLLEYSVKSSSGGRYVLPVVTHTCPDINLLLNPEFESALYAPKSLCLYPFSLKQSVDLIDHLRCERVGEAKRNIDLPRWEKVIALAGGHPSLLVGSFHLLTNPVIVEHNPTTESAVCIALVTNEKMQRFEKSIKNLTSEDAADFIKDCLLLRDVKFEKHSKCLNSGIGWFQPNENGTTGRVSTPFPVLVSLMARCSDQKFSTIAAALNPSAAGFSPTKAMEYVSALTVVLHRTRSIDSWQSCPSHDAFQLLEESTDDFCRHRPGVERSLGYGVENWLSC